jgi:CRP/FNR family transcriptional regulator, cyclic AMP receptor protein
MEDSIDKFINSLPFFKEFNEHERKKLRTISNFVKFNKDDLVFSQGDAGDSLFVVLHGKIGLFRIGAVNHVEEDEISLQKEVEKRVKEIGAGAVFGEISMLTKCNRSVTARVSSNSGVLMKINKKIMEGLNPAAQIKFHKQLLMSLANHLNRMNSQYIDLEYKYDALVAKKPLN